jgi:hypothetical protein
MNPKVPYVRHIVQGLAPCGFNGALLPMNDKVKRFALVYRDDGKVTIHGGDTKGLGLRSCYLNNDYRVVSEDRAMSIPQNIDPRLIWWKDKPYMLSRYIGQRWRIELWPLEITDDKIDVFDGWPHWPFDKIGNWPGYTMPHEVNWTPFVEDDKLFIVHYPRPHRILRVYDDGRIDRVTELDWCLPKGWLTDIRGSTPPVDLHDGTWLGTFHSHSPKHAYHTGFYRFKAHQPWLVISASRTPVYGPEDTQDAPKPWRYWIANVFPSSMQIEGDLVRLCSGLSGVQVAIDHFSLKDILEDMVPI